MVPGTRPRNLAHVSERLLSGDDVVAERIERAGTARQRIRGLLGRAPLADREGLLIERARRIHTIGMRYEIDVLFCDAELRVLHIVRAMKPQRVTRYVRRARFTLELPSGAATGIELGDRLRLVQDPSSDR